MPLADLITHADGRRFLRTGLCDGCALIHPGQCCTFVRLPLARALSADEQRWVALHSGLSIVGQSIQIDVACSALDGGRCSLYGLPERPQLCVRYPELPEQVLAGCAYTLTEIARNGSAA